MINYNPKAGIRKAKARSQLARVLPVYDTAPMNVESKDLPDVLVREEGDSTLIQFPLPFRPLREIWVTRGEATIGLTVTKDRKYTRVVREGDPTYSLIQGALRNRDFKTLSTVV